MPSINQLRQRDRKESDLKALKESEAAANLTIIRSKKIFEKQLQNYQEWKKENGIEGLLF